MLEFAWNGVTSFSTAPLRAIAFGCATAAEVLVRPSRRDPVVAELALTALAEDPAFADAGGRASRVGEVTPEDLRAGDELHVYGSDEAVGSYAARLASGARLRAHGAGFGAALVGPECDVSAAAEALARDVVPFDQRGCLSPRWSQASERRIGSGLFGGRQDTLIFNGYEAEVASLYAGQDLAKDY